MTQINRERIQRAAGIIEGVSFAVSETIRDALAVAIEFLDAALDIVKEDKQ